MKKVHRLAVVLASAALMAGMLPGMAFAVNPDDSGVLPGLDVTQTATATPEPTPTPTPTPTPVPHPEPALNAKAYSINDGKTTVLAQYDTNITLTLNMSVPAPVAEDKIYYVEVKDCDFTYVLNPGRVPVELKANTTNASFNLYGLKLSGGDNKLTLAFYTEANGGAQIGATQTIPIGEAPAATPVPTAVPTAEPTPVPTPAPTAEPIPTPEPDPQAASLIIKSSSIGTESVNAGEEFTLKLTIYATTSGNRNAEDVVVSVAPGEGVTVASGSSSTYIGAMAPGASQTVSFPMKALDSFTGGISTIAVSVTGSGAGSSTNISVPVVQPDRFEITRVECPEILMAGEEDVCTVVFVNKGRNPVNNLTVSLTGTNMTTTNQSEYVGNLAGGTENSVDFDIAGLEAGELTATVTVQYEGNDGEPVVLTQEVSCVIEEAFVDVGIWEDPDIYDEPMPAEPAAAGMPLWGKLLIGIAAIAAVVAVIVLVRKRKAKKAAREAEDEDI